MMTTRMMTTICMTMMISNVCTGLSAVIVAIPLVLRIRKLAQEEEET